MCAYKDVYYDIRLTSCTFRRHYINRLQQIAVWLLFTGRKPIGLPYQARIGNPDHSAYPFHLFIAPKA